MKAIRFLALAGLLSLAACKQSVTPSGTASTSPATAAAPAAPVATVNGNIISRDLFEFYAKAAANKPAAELTPEQRQQLLDGLVSGEVVAQQAGKEGLGDDKDVQSMLSMARLEIMQRAMQQKYLKDKTPTDAQLRAEYDAQIAQMPKTEYHARHILVPTKERAEAVAAMLRKGGNFAQIASKESSDSSKSQGGDLGWFNPSTMVKPFADALIALKKGQTSEPVQSQFGWHIIKLEDTRTVAPPPFENSKQEIAQLVMRKRFKAYVDELLKTAKVEKKL